MTDRLADRFIIEEQHSFNNLVSHRWCVFDTELEGANLVAAFHVGAGIDAESEARNFAERLADYASQEG